MSLTRIRADQVLMSFESDDNLIITTNPVTGAINLSFDDSITINSNITADNVTVANVICTDVVADNVLVNVATANSIITNSSITLNGVSVTTETYRGSTAMMFNGAPITSYGSRVLIGPGTGLVNQGDYSIAMGYLAGTSNQGEAAIAIGDQAGKLNQAGYTVAMGFAAGEVRQGRAAIAIGDQAGKISQGGYTVAMGFAAGEVKQGLNSIAIGAYAGQSNQANNSIILNATGNTLTENTANAFFVKPVRAIAGATSQGFVAVFYNPETGEFVYGTP